MPYTNLPGNASDGTIIPGFKFGYAAAERVRQSFAALAAIRHMLPLGGSRNQALQHSAVVDAYDYIDVEIDSTQLTGLSVRARVELRVADAATSVTPSIRNVTDGVDVVTGDACAATNADYSGTNQKQTLNVPLTAGSKKYRLRLTPSNNTHPFWAIGYLEIFHNGDLVIVARPGSVTITGSSVTLTIT